MRIPSAEELKFLNYRDSIVNAIESARKEAINNAYKFIDMNDGNTAACSDRLTILDHELAAIQTVLFKICELNRKF